MQNLSRRWAFGIAAFVLSAGIVAVRVHGQEKAAPSALFVHDELKATTNATTEIRQMMTGPTHSGFLIDLHETSLAPGQMPHAPHHHVHEEMLLIREGTVEVTVNGRTARLGPGSAAYFASNDQHGWKNVGATPAKYFIVALGSDKSAAVSAPPAAQRRARSGRPR